MNPNNMCVFLGNLGRDPEMQYTSSGNAIVKFPLAVSEQVGSEKRTTWIDCVAFGKQGETLHKYLKKGEPLSVVTRFESRRYEKDGETRYYSNFVITGFSFVRGGGAGGSGGARNQADDDAYADEDEEYAYEYDGDAPF